jgi:peroxiredoxin
MKTFRFAVLTALLMIFLGTSTAAAIETPGTIKTGDPFPSFTARNLDGDEINLDGIVGKKVLVLAFWSIYCKPCVEEISSLIRLQNEFGGSDLEVIGVNTDSELGVARIRKFISRFEEFERKEINYEIIFDEGGKLTKMLGVGFLPTVISVSLDRKVDKIFVGFEEKSEQEIFEGIQALLPTAPEVAETPDSKVFEVEAVIPMCGFYGPEGWVGSFTGNRDIDDEIEKTAEMTRMEATRLLVREALLSLGMNLAEDPKAHDCFRDYGVFLMKNPTDTRDNLSNLVRELTPNAFLRSLETVEDFMGTEFRVYERARIDLVKLRGQLESLGYQTEPRTITFNIVNVSKMDQNKFEKVLLEQSRHIGTFSFPTYEIYTTVENFAKEMERMDFEGLRFFIEEITDESIELEVWR